MQVNAGFRDRSMVPSNVRYTAARFASEESVARLLAAVDAVAAEAADLSSTASASMTSAAASVHTHMLELQACSVDIARGQEVFQRCQELVVAVRAALVGLGQLQEACDTPVPRGSCPSRV